VRVRGRGEGGQALPMVALCLLLAGGGGVVVARIGAASVARTEAAATADMTALAGAVGGRRAAVKVAAANGGRLRRFERVGGDVRVGVERGPAVARARARSDARDDSGLAPAMRAAVARAEQLLGRPVPVASGRRSPNEQAALWAARGRNPFPVARPGSSKHELGLAVDVPSAFVPVLLRVATQAGLCRPYPVVDPVHFELCPSPRTG
jgi:hypothetical protein